MTGPLASLRVLDFSHLLPGPFASMLLADLGADVIRVESPDRPDRVRESPPFDGEISAWHGVLNRSKRSLALDLKTDAAVEVVRRLVGTHDIVIEQFRPGVMAGLGLDYDALRAHNPRLIYCSITGYGQTGPLRDRPGHDINYMALSGIMSHSGRRDAGPSLLGVPVADIGGGSFGAIAGLLAAVIHRNETGEGQLVDVSMLDWAISWNCLAMSEVLIGGEAPRREGTLINGGTYYDFYRTRDGRHLALGALEPKFWRAFCAAIERPDLVEPGLDARPAAQREVKRAIAEALGRRTLDEWVALFDGVDACVEPVLEPREVVEHPQTRARRMIVRVPGPGGRSQPQVASPLRFSRTGAAYRHVGARLGEHTLEILTEAGYGAADVERLRRGGAFGPLAPGDSPPSA